MLLKRIWVLIIFFLILIKGLSQDSIRIDSELDIVTRAQHNIAAINKNFDCFNCRTGRIEDNPIHHLAIYSGVEHKLTLNDRFLLVTGLYLEERSHSGGNNTLSNLVVFPKILLEANGNLSRRGPKYLIRGGDLWNEDVGDILRLYNMDYQGILGKILFDQFSLGFMTIGDLSENVGLDLHQVYRFSLGFNTTKFSNQLSAAINELFAFPQGRHPSATDLIVSNYSKINLSDKSVLEGQVDVRLSNELSPSVAFGAVFTYSEKQLSLSSSVRYYSNDFNLGYNGSRPRYYGPNGSYTGDQLYPLKNFYRNLSQWALYTHMGNIDLLAFEFNSSWTKKIYNKLSGYYDLDFNYIYDIEEGQGYIYPIYSAGLQVNFLPIFNGRISVTNKHMELRNFYQTSSISKAPFLSLGFTLRVEKIKLGSLDLKSQHF